MKPRSVALRLPRAPALIAALAAVALCPALAEAQIQTRPEARRGDPRAALISPGWAPFGSAISEQRIPGYNRATYLIGTSGPLTREGVMEAKRVGFVSILDLQSSPELSRNERLIAEYAVIRYFNLPMSDLPDPQQLQQFAAIVQDPRNLPILVHGQSLDQVGAVWALYRAGIGVPPGIAVVDGITSGLGPSLPAVQARLGLPVQQ
ncbi:MAG: hypothetical protein KJZ80_01690 [Hyphomicrobiaceae bacterium]|nr:hypothetical protein [Hyphomicrobiaceae bacterium]